MPVKPVLPVSPDPPVPPVWPAIQKFINALLSGIGKRELGWGDLRGDTCQAGAS